MLSPPQRTCGPQGPESPREKAGLYGRTFCDVAVLVTVDLRAESAGGTVPAMPLDVLGLVVAGQNSQCSGEFAQLWPRLVQPSDSRTAESGGNNF